MIAIFKRELKSYFQTVIGWLFLAAVLALYGLYFYAYSLRSGYPYISYSISAIAFIMLLAVPFLTMRSLSEERHSKTDQLILTSPVSLGKIILGKYLAMITVLTIDMLLISITPLILSIFGTVPMGESYVAILGFWFYGCACLAIGMLLSSITESQVIAAVLTFGVLFVGYMMSSITNLISETGNILTDILNCFDLYTPLSTFMSGCFDLTGAVYYFSVAALALFLTTQSIQKRRWSITTKKIGTGVFSVGMIVAAFAVAVVLNLFVRELPSSITSIDATSTKLFSLTTDTKEYVKMLEKDIQIYVLADEDSADTTLAETLERYDDLSDCISVSYVSPMTNPLFYQTYTDAAPTTNSLIVVSAERSRVIDYSDIYEYSYDYYSYSSTLEGYDAEGQITSAIQYVSMDSSELPVIYEVEGHGEAALSGGFTESVEKANITLQSLTLLTVDEVPEDAQAVIINGPTSDFSEDDAKKIISYIEKGGSVIVNFDFQYQNLENLSSILAAYGMSRVEGIVMENDANYIYGGTPYYTLPQVESTTYTSSVTGKYIFAPYSEAIAYGEDTDEIIYKPMLMTSSDAVSKVNTENVTTSELEEGDIEGPFALAVAMECTSSDGTTGTLVATGSVQLFTDNADQVVSGNNSAMFTDMISAVTDTEELSLSVIPVKEYTLSSITVPAAKGLLIGVSIMILVPILMLISGIVIWAARRKK